MTRLELLYEAQKQAIELVIDNSALSEDSYKNLRKSYKNDKQRIKALVRKILMETAEEVSLGAE